MTSSKHVNKRSLGVTLFEVLIVIAILAIVSGLLFAGLKAAKSAANESLDVQNLRQIGQAGALYQADYDDRLTYSVVQLVTTGHLQPELAVSPNDPSVTGLGNEGLSNRGLPTAKTKVSYLSFNDPGMDREPDSINASGRTGWVACLLPGFSDTFENGTHFFLPGDQFLRLQLDGAVIKKRAIWRESRENGIYRRSFDFSSLYVDPE